jgi:hypothetical protein
MNPAKIRKELLDIKRELDRRETRGAPTKENNAPRERASPPSKNISAFSAHRPI